MVFGFFSRQKTDQADQPAAKSTEDLLSGPATHLNTPSPTLSAVDAPPQSPEVGLLDDPKHLKRSRSLSPDKFRSTETNITQTEAIHDAHPLSPEELLQLLKRVPAKTLHSYMLARLPTVGEPEASALGSFFKELTPPPRLHCVRCHKAYTEVENTDRSCLVPHDDESAIVEHVGASKKHTYETMWGCCNKTVEGDGSQGPPDGWCYEGYHTTDRKRARFRADATPQDDKLISCRRMRCFVPEGEEVGSGRTKRERAGRKNYAEDEDEEEEDVDVDKLAKEAAREIKELEDDGTKKKTKPVKHRKKNSEVDNTVSKETAMEVEDDARSASGSVKSLPVKPQSIARQKPKSKVEGMKPKPAAKLKSAVQASPPAEGEASQMDGVEVTPSGVAAAEKPRPKKGRPRKSAAAAHDERRYMPSKGEVESSSDEDEDKPKRKKRKST